ncbi:MAG: hypothetical protein ACRCT8_03865 [Lacipirellulaceae bacterium]
MIAITQPPAVGAHQTLPQFLGINGACQAVGGCFDHLRNLLGMYFPGLEATPPILAITDPANMAADAPPAVQAAADVKAQEDQAAQKIKAIRYLATIGCAGCYPDVEDALIASMEDCTEEVRYEAVLAVRETTGQCCQKCTLKCCCSEKMQKKLLELAYKMTDSCCHAEPSARVRRQARMALASCGPAPVKPTPPAEPVPAPESRPTEGATEGDSKAGDEGDEGDGDDETLPEGKSNSKGDSDDAKAKDEPVATARRLPAVTPTASQVVYVEDRPATQPRPLPPIVR